MVTRRRSFKGSRLTSTGWNCKYSTFTDKTVTLAEIILDVGRMSFGGSGNSRRVREDKYDPYAGELLATWRAVKQLESVLKAEAEKYLHIESSEVEGQLSLF